MNKKAQVMQSLGGLAVGIATFSIIMVVAFLVISNTQTQIKDNGNICEPGYTWTNDSTVCCKNEVYALGTGCTGANITGRSIAWNSTGTLQSAAATVPGWIPLIVIIVIGAAILGMIAMFRR